MFLRGQGNAQYLLNPTVLRTEPSREHRLYNDFCRRFPREVRQCENTIEKLQLMQHFRLQTRALDISESPLVALYFACAPSKKYPTIQSDGTTGEQNNWGEITFFRAGPNERKKFDDTAIKTFDSSTVSILANTTDSPRYPRAFAFLPTSTTTAITTICITTDMMLPSTPKSGL